MIVFSVICMSVFIVAYFRTNQLGMAVTWEFWGLFALVSLTCLYLVFLSKKKMAEIVKKEREETFS